MMVRMQISLAPEEHRRARTQAPELGISVAEYVRRLIARDLGEDGAGADPRVLCDLGDSGGSDIAREKHRYVGDAVESLY